jgi:hypothetical protein
MDCAGPSRRCFPGEMDTAAPRQAGLQRLCPPAKRSLGEPHSTRFATSSMSFWRSRPGHPLPGRNRPAIFFKKPWRKRQRDSASLRWNVVGRRQGASDVPPAFL